MSARPFRRPRRWRYVLAGAGLLFLLLRPVCYRDRHFDPNTTIVRAGEYKLTQVREDGLLVIEIERQPGRAKFASFELLGIQLEDPSECATAIRGMAGDVVRLRFDRRRINEEGRLQAYVFVNELLLNEELVRMGLAREATHGADYGPFVRRIKRAEQEARAGKIGIWNASARDSI